MTRLPLSVRQNIPSGDSCKSGDSVCPYWAENSEDGGAYCVVQREALVDYEKTCEINE